jgi:hypothetical protein
LLIYRPSRWFLFKESLCKFVNLTISGGIDPTQSQDKTTKKADGELVHHDILFEVEICLQDQWEKM